MEPEAILPNHALVISSDPVTLSWGYGRSYLMEVYAPVAEVAGGKEPIESVARHIVVPAIVSGQRLLLDFYASAPTAEALSPLDGHLHHLAHSVEVVTRAGEPALPTTRTVSVPDLGLSFAIPAAPEPMSDYVWSILQVQDGRVGFNVEAFEPPMHPETIMPGPAAISKSEPVTFAWGEGRSYTLEVFAPTSPSPEDERAPVESVERHVVTVEVDEQLYVVDFFAASRTADHLAALEPVLQTMLRSAAFN